MTAPEPAPHLGQTPSQTVGPFFSFSLGRFDLTDVFPDADPATKVTLTGQVLDGEDTPVPDAVIELWQADASGRFPASRSDRGGFGRSCTDTDGRYRFTTVVPGVVAAADGTPQAPHATLVVFARGLLRHAFTRVYLCAPDDAAAQADPVLAAVPPSRRHTLFAHDDDGGFRFDIHLQGPAETVFLDL